MKDGELTPDQIKNIPIQFAALLVTGYQVPISQIVPEEEIDNFLDKNPHLIEEKKDSVVEKIS